MGEKPSVYLFNPENDIALAVNQKRFTMSKHVAEFHNDAAFLPIWYSDEPDSYVVYGERNVDAVWLEKVTRHFGLTAMPIQKWTSIAYCKPWGWSANAAWQYERIGVPSSCLPDAIMLERYRDMSHRRSVVNVYEQLVGVLPYQLPECPVEVNDVELLRVYASSHHDGFFIKAPWSSSGRGVMDSTEVSSSKILEAAQGIMRNQGSVMLEQRLDKVQDFAMLFYADESGLISHRGYSVFSTYGQGCYAGNLVASDEILLKYISRYVDTNSLEITAKVMTDVLNRVCNGWYKGWLGVDMMVYKDREGEMHIYPCVEINFRMTMGVVAKLIAAKFIPDEAVGLYSVSYDTSQQTDAATYIAEGGKLIRGTVDLLPPSSRFKIRLSLSENHVL